MWSTPSGIRTSSSLSIRRPLFARSAHRNVLASLSHMPQFGHMARRYKKSWSRPVRVEPWMTPATLLLQYEAARFLNVSPLTLRRLARGDSGPPSSKSYGGRACYYRISDLLVWRGSVTGLGPHQNRVWDWWARQGYSMDQDRVQPLARGNRPVGVRVRHWQQRERVRLRGLVHKADLLDALARIGRPSITAEWLPIIRSE